MGFGPFSSESTANQSTQTVTDSGQLITGNSKVAQGNAKQGGGKGSIFQEAGAFNLNLGKGNNFGLDLSKTKLGKNAQITVNSGASESTLNSLVGNLSSATNAQIAALASQINASQGSGGGGGGGSGSSAALDSQLNRLSDLLPSDAEIGPSKVIFWVGIAAAVGVVYFIIKKL